VLAAGMLVADVLVLVDDCTPYKCCIICSLTSYEKIKKFAHTEAEKHRLFFANAVQFGNDTLTDSQEIANEFNDIFYRHGC
jgi:hypothetical protein